MWDTFVCLFKIGDKKGAYTAGLTSDGKQAESASMFGNTGLSVLDFLKKLHEQGVPFPFSNRGEVLDYKKLGVSNSFFFDSSDEEGNRKPESTSHFQTTAVLNYFEKKPAGAMDMNSFTAAYDHDGYRYADVSTGELHKVDGTGDPTSTEAFKAVMGKADSSAPETDSAFIPGGNSAKTATLDEESVGKTTRAVHELNKALSETKDLLNKSAALDEAATRVLLKMS